MDVHFVAVLKWLYPSRGWSLMKGWNGGYICSLPSPCLMLLHVRLNRNIDGVRNTCALPDKRLYKSTSLLDAFVSRWRDFSLSFGRSVPVAECAMSSDVHRAARVRRYQSSPTENYNQPSSLPATHFIICCTTLWPSIHSFTLKLCAHVFLLCYFFVLCLLLIVFCCHCSCCCCCCCCPPFLFSIMNLSGTCPNVFAKYLTIILAADCVHIMSGVCSWLASRA